MTFNIIWLQFLEHWWIWNVHAHITQDHALRQWLTILDYLYVYTLEWKWFYHALCTDKYYYCCAYTTWMEIRRCKGFLLHLSDRDNRNKLMGKQLTIAARFGIIVEQRQTNKLQAQLPLYVSVKKTSLWLGWIGCKDNWYGSTIHRVLWLPCINAQRYNRSTKHINSDFCVMTIVL